MLHLQKLKIENKHVITPGPKKINYSNFNQCLFRKKLALLKENVSKDYEKDILKIK